MVVLNASLSQYYFVNFVERKIHDNTDLNFKICPIIEKYLEQGFTFTKVILQTYHCLVHDEVMMPFPIQFMSLCSFKTQVQEINKILIT